MICPQCHLFTPDNSFRCIHCGAIAPRSRAPKPGSPDILRPGSEKSFFRPWMLLPLAMLAVLVYLFFAQQNKIQGHQRLQSRERVRHRILSAEAEKSRSSIFTAIIARPAGRSRRC